jgi:hypothetical protein
LYALWPFVSSNTRRATQLRFFVQYRPAISIINITSRVRRRITYCYLRNGQTISCALARPTKTFVCFGLFVAARPPFCARTTDRPKTIARRRRRRTTPEDLESSTARESVMRRRRTINVRHHRQSYTTVWLCKLIPSRPLIIQMSNGVRGNCIDYSLFVRNCTRLGKL